VKLEDAIAAHTEWKFKLRQFVDNTGEAKLQSAIVASDSACALGRWMHGDGKKLETVPEFREARAAHAEFHRCAGEVVRAVETNDRTHASSLLAASGAFERSSQLIGTCLVRLRKAIRG